VALTACFFRSTVKVCTLYSVSDPDSLDSDPDLGFLVNPDPDPDPGF
jgi:hypothetical protein